MEFATRGLLVLSSRLSEMGVQGAAIATVTAEWAAALTFLVLLERKDPAIRLGYFTWYFPLFFPSLVFLILRRMG